MSVSVSWLNYLIQAVDQWGFSDQHAVKRIVDLPLESSTQLHIHHAASHRFLCSYNSPLPDKQEQDNVCGV